MKSKGLTNLYIIFGVISILTLSIFLVSNTTFIYSLVINNFDEINSNNAISAYKDIISYVLLGGNFEEIGIYKYSEEGKLYLSLARDLFFDLKIYLIISVGFFIMLTSLFSKNSLYTYSKITNRTPYLYIGYFSIIISLIVLLSLHLDKNAFIDNLRILLIGEEKLKDEFIKILPNEYFIAMIDVAMSLVIVISLIFVLLDILIIRKERENMNIKLVAIDLDGTLLNDKKEIQERTFKALMKAKEKGVYIVLASGRPIRGMLPLIKKLGLDEKENYVINFNGAAINKTSDLSSIFNCSLTIDEMLEIESFAKEHNIHSHAFIDGECYIEEDGEYSDVEASINGISLNTVKYNELKKDAIVNKYMFADEPNKLKEIYSLIPSSIFEKYTVVFSAPFFLEFLNKNTNKGKALEALAKYLNISADEVMAIGDEENDLSMLEYATHKVAMGNANKKLKDIATFISDTNNEDGVGKAVEKLILNKL